MGGWSSRLKTDPKFHNHKLQTMAITFEKQSFSGHFPEIWRGECKMLPGGFKPKHELPVGTVVRRATPVFVNFDDMSAAICKTASVLDGGTTTKVRVPKGHYFAKGDSVAKHGDAATDPVIVNSIDTSNSSYDTLMLSAAITGIKKDDIIIEAVKDGGTVKAAYEPNMVVGADKNFDGRGLPTIDAAFEAVVLLPSLMFPILPEWKTGVSLKLNPNIIFIKQ